MFDDLKRIRMKHCSFAKISKTTGKCIAICRRQGLVEPGLSVDCIGMESEPISKFLDRLDKERKLT